MPNGTEGKQNATKTLLTDYLTLEKNNPGGLNDQQIAQGLPQLNKIGLPVNETVQSLKEFKVQLDSAPKDQIKGMVDQFVSGLGGAQEKLQGTTTDIQPTTTDVQPTTVTPKEEPSVSKNIISTFLTEDKNNPGGVTDDMIISQLDQAGITQNRNQVVSSLRGFRTNLDSQPKESVSKYLNSYIGELDGILKKKKKLLARLVELAHRKG